mmetsp:Transcript_43080/g.50527  ORF Transcript_43080/g.50527 Transcript_43080/m.50527 type:complete len:84 (+) Transcript_43080:170-421(+)
MLSTDKTAKELEASTNTLNKLIDEYKSSMEKSIKDLEDMERQRNSSIVDALNQINIFQTNCDMNNKYDSNNFTETVDTIDIGP